MPKLDSKPFIFTLIPILISIFYYFILLLKLNKIKKLPLEKIVIK